MMWIEVLSRHGDVASRNRIDSDEARLGRAFDNDVVLDDPYVAPHHVRIFRTEEGELAAEDLGTLNGLYAEHGARRATRIALAKEPGLRIGRTIVRVRDGASSVDPERLLTPPRAHARWAAGLGVALILVVLILQWLANTGEASANLAVLPILGIATAIAVWASLWSMQSRLFLGQSRFAVHLRIALTAALAILVWDQLDDTLSFAFASRAIAEWGGLGLWALLAGACYAHLRAIDTRHMNLAMGLVVALLTAGALLQYLGRSESKKILGERATLGDLRPPAFRLVPLASADEFFKKAEGAKRRVDELRVKEPAGPVEPELND